MWKILLSCSRHPPIDESDGIRNLECLKDVRRAHQISGLRKGVSEKITRPPLPSAPLEKYGILESCWLTWLEEHNETTIKRSARQMKNRLDSGNDLPSCLFAYPQLRDLYVESVAELKVKEIQSHQPFHCPKTIGKLIENSKAMPFKVTYCGIFKVAHWRSKERAAPFLVGFNGEYRQAGKTTLYFCSLSLMMVYHVWMLHIYGL